MTGAQPDTHTPGTRTAKPETHLAARVRLAITRTARRLRQESGADLTPSQLAALATIDRHGPVTPSELAEAERIQRPTATRVAGKLEDAGLVARSDDPGDRRSSLLSVTPEGRATLERVRSRKDAYLAERLDDLSADDRAALARAADVLERLLEEDRRS